MSLYSLRKGEFNDDLGVSSNYKIIIVEYKNVDSIRNGI